MMNDLSFLEALGITLQVAWKVTVNCWPLFPLLGIFSVAMYVAEKLDVRFSK